jgi:hypothetical protein
MPWSKDSQKKSSKDTSITDGLSSSVRIFGPVCENEPHAHNYNQAKNDWKLRSLELSNVCWDGHDFLFFRKTSPLYFGANQKNFFENLTVLLRTNHWQNIPHPVFGMKSVFSLIPSNVTWMDETVDFYLFDPLWLHNWAHIVFDNLLPGFSVMRSPMKRRRHAVFCSCLSAKLTDCSKSLWRG